MKCPFCDAIVPTGSRACHFCGEPIPRDISAAGDSPVVDAKEPSVQSDQVSPEVSTTSPKNDVPVTATDDATNSSAELNGRNTPQTITPMDESPIEKATPKINETENVDQECIEISRSSEMIGAEKSSVPEKLSNESTVASKKTKWFTVIAVLMFLGGVIVGGLLFRGGQPQEDVTKEDSSDNGTSIEISPNLPSNSEDADAVPSHEQDEQNSLPETSGQPSNDTTEHESEERIVTPNEGLSDIIDSRFEGVWMVYLANADGSMAYDDNGDAIFTGSLLVVDLKNTYIFNIGEDGTLSNKWAIQKTEQSDTITFWAENGYFSLARLVTDTTIQEICGTSATNTFNTIWVKIDSAIPSYEDLLAGEEHGGASSSSDNTKNPPIVDAPQPTSSAYAEFPGVPDFGALNCVNPYTEWSLDGKSKAYIYLYSDLKTAGTYTMSYNLYDQELLKWGFSQTDIADNSATGYVKCKNGVTSAVIVKPSDSYNGLGCISIIVGTESD